MTAKPLRCIAAALALFAAACTNVIDTSGAEREVANFHLMLDSGRAADIYSRASDDLKKAATEKDFVDLLAAVHRKLGTVASSQKVAWYVQATTSGKFVTLNYKTVFSEGGAEAAERFIYRVDGDQALLAGYFINSNALITR